MPHKKTITVLVILMALLSGIAAASGIFTHNGPGPYSHESIRGETVEIYGKGIYQQMSADVAIQGIAQDYITLFIAIPVLLISLLSARRGSLRSRFLMAGTSMYFFVTYLFYTTMGMYNLLFLVYAAMIALSFFSLFLSVSTLNATLVATAFNDQTPVRSAGGLLIAISSSIALLWLSVVVPPLLDGSVYPESLQHYTTLIVQGLDLGLLLPVAFVCGILLIRRHHFGFLGGTVYWIFLSFLMTALTAKLIAMSMNGVSVIPAIFIIPVFNLLAVVTAVRLLLSVNPGN